MRYLTYQKRNGFNIDVSLILIGFNFHICSHCGSFSIDLFSTFRFQYMFRDRQYSESVPIVQPTEDDMAFMHFNNRMQSEGYSYIIPPMDENRKPTVYILRWANYEGKIISINKGGAVNIMNNDSFEEFINSNK
jgi:hypothetical protein